MKRRLVAILVGDVVGYSSMMEVDEEGTASAMRSCRAIADSEVIKAEGRVFKAMGDAILAEFASPINAIHCAVSIRDSLAMANQGNGAQLRMRFGLHLADVLIEGNDLIGDGVNLAARIQQAAEPGAIDLSSTIFNHIRRNSPYFFDDLGEKHFHNITEPVQIYRLSAKRSNQWYHIASARSERNQAARPQSLAVMPLNVSSNDEDQKFFAEGIAEDLIFELGRFKKLFVTSLSATRALNDNQADPRIVGERLGVRYLLTGSIRQLGPRLRLSLTLTETATRTVVWSDRLNQPFEKLVSNLDELVSRISSTVLGRIEDTDITLARRMKPDSMTAYEFHLRGLGHHRQGSVTLDNLRTAVKWYRRAIDADPNFARPRAMLACAWSNLPDFNYAEGIGYVEQALELDPNEPEANRVMGAIKSNHGDFESARHYFEKALALSPSDINILASVAMFYTIVSEPLRSLEVLNSAAELDPFLPVICVEERLIAYYVLGRYDEVVEIGSSLPYQRWRSRLYCAASRVAIGDFDTAKKIVRATVMAAPGINADLVQQSEMYRDREVSRLFMERLSKAGLR